MSLTKKQKFVYFRRYRQHFPGCNVAQGCSCGYAAYRELLRASSPASGEAR